MLCPSPWFNLRHQQYQPNSAHGPHGYLLTPVEDLPKLKDKVHYKDKKGIIRIRASFMQTRANLHDVNGETLPSSSVQAALSLQPRVPHDQHAESHAMSAVDIIRNMFRHKPSKAFESEAARPGTADERSNDRGSVEQAPVSLHLSRKAAPRYGLALVRDESPCLELHDGDAYSGGACLVVHPSDHLCPEHRDTRLFHCDFACEEALIFCVVTKTLHDYPEQTLNVKLHMRNAADEELIAVLTGRDLAVSSSLSARASGISYVYPLRTACEDVLRELRTYLLLSQPGHYVPVDNHFGWTVR